MFKLRWPDGFSCPRCGGNKSWPGRGILRECAACGYQCSVTAGTIFQDTRTPLRLWFQAMWWMTTQKNGASALGLQRVLGLKQYQTAWTWLHKLRSAMVRPGRDLLTGRIEVDECYLGALEEGLRGRLIESNALIVVAAQENGRGIGRIRLRQIPDASAESLHPFILDSVTAGSVIHTDGWRGYSGIETKGYLRQITGFFIGPAVIYGKVWRPEEGQTGGCYGSTELGVVVPSDTGAKFFCENRGSSIQKGEGQHRHRCSDRFFADLGFAPPLNAPPYGVAGLRASRGQRKASAPTQRGNESS